MLLKIPGCLVDRLEKKFKLFDECINIFLFFFKLTYLDSV